jgi:hypothetical protein
VRKRQPEAVEDVLTVLQDAVQPRNVARIGSAPLSEDVL